MNRRDFLKIAGSGMAASFLSSCIFPTGIDEGWLEANSYEIEPLPEFREWYNEISECSDLSGDFDSLTWYHVQNSVIPCRVLGKSNKDVGLEEGVDCFFHGFWNEEHNAIYIGDRTFKKYSFGKGSDKYGEAKIEIQHEMLHSLERKKGHSELFDRCGVRLNS